MFVDLLTKLSPKVSISLDTDSKSGTSCISCDWKHLWCSAPNADLLIQQMNDTNVT